MTTVQDAIWVEKYRPETLDQIMGNEKEIRRMQEWVDDPAMPNVLLWGPQGTGKTATAKAFCNEKYGDEWKNHLLHLNASDERGIETVRKKIKGFASQGGVMGEHDFNIVLLDEVDNMTRDAQPAMRTIMEDFHDRTRFFLICNYPNKLIDPLQSRCAPLHISPLRLDQIIDLLEKVAVNEDLEYTNDQLGTIARAADGDARVAIHRLQSATSDGVVVDDFMHAVTSLIERDSVEELVQTAINGDQATAMDLVDEFIKQGVDVQALCNEISEVLYEEYQDDLPADSLSLLDDKVADCEWRIIHGSNPDIQLRSLVTDLRMARHVSLNPYREDSDRAQL